MPRMNSPTFAPVLSAFARGQHPVTRGNTSVSLDCWTDSDPSAGNCYTLRLHGNAIVRRSIGGTQKVWVSLAGWDTQTTRRRINQALMALGVDAGVYREKGQTMLSGVPMPSRGWVPIIEKGN